MSVTKESWARSLLQGLGAPVTPANLRAIVGWEEAEGGNWNNNATFNPLNTTQPAPGAGNTGSQGNIKQYTSWQQGLNATIQTLRNGYYKGILAALAAGTNPGAVASAIGSSPWGTSGSLVAQTIGAASGQGGGTTITPSGGTPLAKVASIPSVKTPTVAGPNIFNTLAGLEAARQAVGGDTSSTPDALQQGWDVLAQLISPSSSPSVTRVPNTVRNNLSLATGGGVPGKGDLNPLQGWNIGRTDMGVDASAQVGKQILAPNNSRVVHVYNNWFHGQPYVLLQLTAGPNKGKYYYVAEQIDNLPAVGSYIPRGGVVARFAQSGTGIEMGWGTPGWQTQAQATTGYSEGQVTPAGQSFKQTFGINLAKATPQPVAGSLPENQSSTPTTPLPKASPTVPKVNPALMDLPIVKPPPVPKSPTITLPQLKLPTNAGHGALS